jgi:hypothetical protein
MGQRWRSLKKKVLHNFINNLHNFWICNDFIDNSNPRMK